MIRSDWRLRKSAGGNAPTVRRKTLFVDVSVIVRHDAGTGIQRVVRAIGEHLHASAQGEYAVRFVAASRRMPFRYVDGAFLRGRSKFASGSWFVRPRRGDIFLGLDLSSRVLPAHGRQIARWRRSGVRIAVFVYDLLPINHPEWFEDRHARAFVGWAHFVAQNCDLAICISETVRRTLLDWVARAHPEARGKLKASSIPLGGD